MNVYMTQYSKRANSTARPADTSSYTLVADCQLKQPSSVVNPVFILSQSSFSVNYNFCYIPDWGRWYTIDDAVYMTGQRVEVTLSCDYLATWRSNISGYTAYVERCADSDYYDTTVEDNYLSNSTTIANSQIATTALGGGFDRAVGFYILRTIGNSGTVSSFTGITSYVLTLSEITDVLSYMFTDTNFSDVISDETVKTFFNPFQYIVDIKWIPCDYTTYADNYLLNKTNVKFGWWDSGVNVWVIQGGISGVSFYSDSINIPDNAFSDWRRYSDRFSSYLLYLPGVGTVNISANETWEGLCCRYDLDLATGDALCSLYTGHLNDDHEPTGSLISTYNTQLAVPIQLGQLGSTVTRTTSSIISGITGALTGKGIIANAITSALDATTSALQPTPSLNGAAGERFIINQNPDIKMSINNLTSCEYPTTVAGRPCYKNIQLGSLSGYVKCGGASLSLPGYDTDAETVNNWLNSGFYME